MLRPKKGDNNNTSRLAHWAQIGSFFLAVSGLLGSAYGFVQVTNYRLAQLEARLRELTDYVAGLRSFWLSGTVRNPTARLPVMASSGTLASEWWWPLLLIGLAGLSLLLVTAILLRRWFCGPR